MVTLFDVARLAGVSTATVSRVVHGQDRVREATRIRVQRAIEELGYVPDSAAQSLSRRRKDVIGMVCNEQWSRLRYRRSGYPSLDAADLKSPRQRSGPAPGKPPPPGAGLLSAKHPPMRLHPGLADSKRY